jgi:rubredoxin
MSNWKCSNCGYQLESPAPPEECPSCKQKCEFVDNTCYTPDCAGEGIDKRIRPKT